ncbi:hypothetical protein CEXT_114431 [Caerostris extrusa]|uniref:Uncharacterized protein n=1 Tax=Caerostris extrusa TaxID=172846 RepID=A0AAV4R301_CAEEX|nr:hypothetical protein CEXT_114431 [Caerostris extrusa]
MKETAFFIKQRGQGLKQTKGNWCSSASILVTRASSYCLLLFFCPDSFSSPDATIGVPINKDDFSPQVVNFVPYPSRGTGEEFSYECSE